MRDAYSPPYFRVPRPLNPQAPLFIYLPGMDGTGQLLSRQLAGLEQAFDIRCLTLPPSDLTPWDQLTSQVVRLIEAELEHGAQQPVYLCAESFGGCLALKVMERSPHLFDRLILLNPATSFKQSFWIYWGSHLIQPVPDLVYQASCVGFLPFLAALERIEASDRRALLDAMQSVTQKASIWRMSLLREFELSDTVLRNIHQPTLVVGSQRDRLLPSMDEAQRLVGLMPNAQMHLLPDSGHACLLESAVDLYDILKVNQFLQPSRNANGNANENADERVNNGAVLGKTLS
ncbi:MAG: alpha/beta hydrolase [Drouetiella hepatica Uher 2000/2452]|jgi:pimeloyl-ACP methyl ester carboxylesterase|uniref:Alpha/beta hydrolase n=1 Tax=Drouetiella hepatica Uher 2000/2452 TaxID=904376 RepID=A0A951Q8N1_9CYAN|nr:alpha/beta hydrolase [Drouetiella hepatica Uher 2000/2452]